MIAIREQVVAAFAALLDGLVDANGDAVTVERGRTAAVSSWPLLQVEEGIEQGREVSYGQLDLTMGLTLVGHVMLRADEGDPDAAGPGIMAAITDLYARALRTVLAEPRTLGGLASDIRFMAMTPHLAEDSADQVGGFTAELEIDYWVSSSNPFSQDIGS